MTPDGVLQKQLATKCSENHIFGNTAVPPRGQWFFQWRNRFERVSCDIPFQIFPELIETMRTPCEWDDDNTRPVECTHIYKIPLGQVVHLVLFNDPGKETVGAFHPRNMDRRNLENRADSRPAPSHWETSLQSNTVTVSHWLGTNLESDLVNILKPKQNTWHFVQASMCAADMQLYFLEENI